MEEDGLWNETKGRGAEGRWMRVRTRKKKSDQNQSMTKRSVEGKEDGVRRENGGKKKTGGVGMREMGKEEKGNGVDWAKKNKRKEAS